MLNTIKLIKTIIGLYSKNLQKIFMLILILKSLSLTNLINIVKKALDLSKRTLVLKKIINNLHIKYF